MATPEELQAAFKSLSTSLSLTSLAMNDKVVTSAAVTGHLSILRKKIDTLLELTAASPPMSFERTDLSDWIVRSLSSGSVPDYPPEESDDR